MSDNDYVRIYIGRHENILLDHVRKQLDIETKSIILDNQLKEYTKKIEELEQHNTSLTDMVNQSTNGLRAVTNERDQLKEKFDNLKATHNTVTEELVIIRLEKQNALNRIALLEQDINELNINLETASQDNITLKENYSIVLEELDTLKCGSESTSTEDKKKPKSTKNSSWT
jgi:chromosome segregation ATPase